MVIWAIFSLIAGFTLAFSARWIAKFIKDDIEGVAAVCFAILSAGCFMLGVGCFILSGLMWHKVLF